MLRRFVEIYQFPILIKMYKDLWEENMLKRGEKEEKKTPFIFKYLSIEILKNLFQILLVC